MFLFGAVFEPVGGTGAALSRIESTLLRLATGVQVIPTRAKTIFFARCNNEQLLRMFVDADQELEVEIQPRRDNRWGNPGLDAKLASALL